MPCFRLPLVSLVFVLLCSGLARAGDFEDCIGPLGDKTEASCTAVLDDAQRPAEDRIKAYINRSRLFTSRGKLDAGLADAEAALALNPQSASALATRAYARQRSGNRDAAVADYTHALELEPKDPLTLTARGHVRADQKAWPDALSDFDEAINQRRDYAAAYVG
jgi:tetratricopeptide (TPR) repeat protein